MGVNSISKSLHSWRRRIATIKFLSFNMPQRIAFARFLLPLLCFEGFSILIRLRYLQIKEINEKRACSLQPGLYK